MSVNVKEEQWRVLRNYLKNKGFIIKEGGNAGHGVKNYTSGGQLKKSYDLSNWRWIDILFDDITVFISFQPMITHPTSKQTIICDNRIGVSWYHNEPDYDFIASKMKYVDIYLPLEDKDLAKIIDLIIKTKSEAKKELNVR